MREAIGRRYGLDAEQIVCGNGSDDLIALLAHVYPLGPATKGSTANTASSNIRSPFAPPAATPVIAEGDATRPPTSTRCCAKVSARTKIVFLANPNNPTGTYLPFAEVKRLHAGLPGDTLLVLDAAYAEYVTRNDYAAGIELVSANENVVMTRTFSKIYGLANLRIGWAYAPARDRRRAEPRARRRSTSMARRSRRASRRSTTPRHVEAAVAHNARWLPWLSEEIASARRRGDAERRQFPAAAISRDRRAHGERRRRLF